MQSAIRNPKSEIGLNPTFRIPHSAFSLVELVIVIVIIGIIAAIAVPRFSSATTNANTAQAKGSAQVLQNALDLFLAEHSTYAATESGLDAALDSGAANILENKTKADGTIDNSTGTFGPYLRKTPSNTLVHPTSATLFLAGSSTGQGTSDSNGWNIDDNNGTFRVGWYSAKGTGSPVYE